MREALKEIRIADGDGKRLGISGGSGKMGNLSFGSIY